MSWIKTGSTACLAYLIGLGAAIAQTTMPSVVGLTQEQASEVLAEAGIPFIALPGPWCIDPDRPVVVIDQEPNEGEKLPEGASATFLLPTPASARMPDLSGQSCATAETLREMHEMGGATSQVFVPYPKIEQCNLVENRSTITDQNIDPGIWICPRLSLFATCEHTTIVDKSRFWNGSGCIAR